MPYAPAGSATTPAVTTFPFAIQARHYTACCCIPFASASVISSANVGLGGISRQKKLPSQMGAPTAGVRFLAPLEMTRDDYRRTTYRRSIYRLSSLTPTQAAGLRNPMGLALLGLLFIAGPVPTAQWKSVVYAHRTVGTGIGSLRARTSDLIHLKAPRHVAIRAVFYYQPAKDVWARMPLDSIPSITLRRARPRQIYSAESDPVLFTIPQPVGLFWVSWDEDGHRLSSAVYAAPILCEDVMLGPASPGHVAMCVPFADRAEARFVPDPSGL